MNMPWLAGATRRPPAHTTRRAWRTVRVKAIFMYAAAGRAVRPAVGHGRDPTLGRGARLVHRGPVGLYIIAFVRYMAKCTYMECHTKYVAVLNRCSAHKRLLPLQGKYEVKSRALIAIIKRHCEQ